MIYFISNLYNGNNKRDERAQGFPIITTTYIIDKNE